MTLWGDDMRRHSNFFPKDTVVTLHASAGSNIGDCLNEAIIMALTEERIVVFDFNGVEMRIVPEDIRAPFQRLYNKSFDK